MSSPAQYFQRRTNMSRANCSFLLEHFRLDAETGLLASVSVYEDGLAYTTAPAPLRVPVLAVPSTAHAYAAARYKALRSMARRRAQQRAEKALRKKVDDMRKALAEMEQSAALARPARAVVVPVPVPVATSVEVTPSTAVVARSTPPAVASPTPSTGPQLLDDYTVIDLEFQVDALLEIAAVRFQHGEQVGEYVSFVRCREKIWAPITQLTGITALHVWDAPEEKHVLQQFKKLAGDSLLVCHSISADRRILEAARTRCGATAELANPWLCTLALARRHAKAGLLPKSLKLGLGELCHHFDLKVRGAHRAKADALMCAQLLRKLHAQQPVTKADLHGAPQPGRGRKPSTVATPGLLFEAA